MNKREAGAILRALDKMDTGLYDEAKSELCLIVAGDANKRSARKAIPKKRAKARRGPMRDPKYRQWCRYHDCVVQPHQDCRYAGDGNGSDPAHTQNNGTSSKGPDSSCVPLCRKHHDEYDAGREAFEKKYGVDMKALAAEHYARFCAENT